MIDAEIPATMEAADAALTATESPETTPEAVTAEPVAQPEGQPRDEAGRFTSPAPKVEEPEASVTDDPAPAPETPSEPTTEPATEAPVEYPSLAYRADGQEFAFEGSAVGEDGAFIPAKHLPELQQLLSAGKAAFGSVRQRLSEAASREHSAVARAEAAEAQATHLLSHFEELVQSGKIGEWLEGVAQNWPVLKAQAQAKAIELQAKADREALEQFRQRETEQAQRPLMDRTLEQAVADFGGRAGLDDATRAEVLRVLREPHLQSAVFVKAPMDDPAAGFKKGELVIDFSVVQAEVARAKNWLMRSAPAQKIAQAQARNAAKVAPPKVTPPPTVGAKGTKAPKTGAPIPTFKSTKEADAWFEQGGYNEIE